MVEEEPAGSISGLHAVNIKQNARKIIFSAKTEYRILNFIILTVHLFVQPERLELSHPKGTRS